MKTINFYITPYKSFAECVNFCCRLIHKAYKKKLSCIIYTESSEVIHRIDSALWSEPVDNFIPHHINPEHLDQLIVSHTNTKDQAPVWINCRSADKIAPESNWDRCLQIVPNDTQLLQIARQQYRHYEDTGATIKTHKIG